jgi:hypothetical protein
VEVAVSSVPAAVESSPVAERPRRRAGSGAQWLILCCYLLGAVALTWRLWVDPASRAQVGDPEDVDLFAWFMRYAATAAAHGHLPALVTTALNAPRGINAMWNTSFLLPGIVLSPVTLLAGPQVSLTIALTLGFAGSAASLFWVLRRWGASIWPAALGGALYGFSPALLDSAIGHYHMQFAVLPPLIIDALLRIVTGRGPASPGGRPAGALRGPASPGRRPPGAPRGSAVRTGAWLGLLTAAQVFIGEELLTLTAVAGLLLVLVLAAGQPRAARHRVRGAVIGLATGAGVALVICGYALWVQFRGPLSQSGNPWIASNFASHVSDLVSPPGSVLFHTQASAAAAAGGTGLLPEYLAYLGWPLLVVLVAAAVGFWRDPRVRATAVTFAVLELFSLDGGTRFLPWHWLQGLPVLGEVLPDRFAIVADGAAAAVLAFSLDLARTAAPQASAWRRRNLPFAVAVLALLPLIPLPMQAGTVPPVPAGWHAAFARLRLASDARVLVVPVPHSHFPQAMRWQADTGEPGSLIGGWFVGPNQNGQAAPEYFGSSYGILITIVYLDDLWAGSPTHTTGIPWPWISAALAYLRPAAVVAVTRRGSPLGRVLSRIFGPPTFRVGHVLAWRR